MLFEKRRWQVADVDDAEQLAEKLTQHTWTLCAGFRYRGLLYLNDSTCEDGAQEYCIIRESDMCQVETITFGWCNVQRALGHIKMLTESPPEEQGRFPVRVDTPEEHGRCSLCA